MHCCLKGIKQETDTWTPVDGKGNGAAVPRKIAGIHTASLPNVYLLVRGPDGHPLVWNQEAEAGHHLG